MKTGAPVLLLGFLAAALPAQNPALIQNSTVREQNSNKRPVAGVQVIFEGAVPTASGQDGRVRLAFSNKKPGALVFLTEVTKAGYELVNAAELEQVKLSNSDQLGIDIILAKAGAVDAAKKEYYGISDQALLAGFEKEKRRLRSALSEARLTQQQFEEQFGQLQAQYENQKKELDLLAGKFARVNFDDVDTLYREALQLFKTGAIDAAIEKLEAADPAKRTGQIIREEQRIGEAQKELDAQRLALAKDKQDQIVLVRLLADMYALKFDLDKAEAQYDQLLRLDSSDLAILSDAADFYRQNHRYDKALQLLPRMIAHPQATDWQKANAYGHEGDLYTALGQPDAALQAYVALQNGYAKLLNANPGIAFYKNNLAVSYDQIGNIQTALGRLDQALLFYKQSYQLAQELQASYPESPEFTYQLANSYAHLGATQLALGHPDQALAYFEKALELSEALYAGDSLKVLFKSSLASSYQYLGQTHSALNAPDRALSCFERCYALEKELYAAYPAGADFQHGVAIAAQFLGNTYITLGKPAEALPFLEQYHRLAKALSDAYPQNVSFKDGLAISCCRLGAVYSDLGHPDQAVPYYEQCNQLEKELSAANPSAVGYKNAVALSNGYLGDAHTALGDLAAALPYYEQSNQVLQALSEAAPQNVDFKYSLSVSYAQLGETHARMKHLTKSVPFFEAKTRLLEELSAAFPQNTTYKNSLALSYAKLGEIHATLGHASQIQPAFEQCRRLEKELSDAYPQNPDFKNTWAVACYNLGKYRRSYANDPAGAKIYLRQAETLWLELVRDAPKNEWYQRMLKSVQQDLAD